MRDIDVRHAIWEQLRAEHADDDDTRLLDEFGLEHGDVRVDVVVINGEIHGYELKSERDTLTRLPRQVTAYSAALDRATLVVAEGHLAKASALVPEWWGLSIAHSVEGRAVRVEAHRLAARNPEQQMISVARLLWRPEALALLEQAGAARGVRSKPRAFLYERLTECLAPDQLRDQVRAALKARSGWRSAAPRT
ncbi:sce7726 family protein [Corallococcus exiguus]|uniref:Sce7726 family protein n=1 Tax=Corallococcus exiguus TaxID=83462 RepID=A0A7X4Y886_9BACT|nr:sce7726 family protein [Corallococcus exiguus]NBC40450.1 sce7726 family protein [Corallococcus exiguus]TNV64066.1 sce7726 family protein [Corallococcus exiguus]